jgi:hypothetical protein
MTYFNIHFRNCTAIRKNLASAILLGTFGVFPGGFPSAALQADSGGRLSNAQRNNSADIHSETHRNNTSKRRLTFGNLRKLILKGENGHYVLNGFDLPKITSGSLEMSTTDHGPCRVQASFLPTVLISKSRPVSISDKDLLATWEQHIPLVAHILKEQDAFGSIKPIAYDLIEARDRGTLQLQEELVLLWSADPVDDSTIGETRLFPPTPFRDQIIDVQYRGIKKAGTRLVGKIMLQVLYIRKQDRPATLGAFVIVSKPSGEYEFYSVPRALLDRIIISEK